MDTLLTCQRFKVIEKQIPTSDGGKRPYEIVAHPGAVVILPLLRNGRQVVMIRNYRHTIDQELWELPAGTLDHPDESPTAAAQRELEEETGYQPGRLTPLGTFYPSPGVMTELIHAFVAADLIKTRQRLEATERITVELLDFPETIRMIRDGRILDGKTIITLLKWDLDQRNPL
jgi:ADP-ribose pyrophosphatase